MRRAGAEPDQELVRCTRLNTHIWGGMTPTMGGMTSFGGGSRALVGRAERGAASVLDGAQAVTPLLAALFGSRTAACVLLFLQCYGEGHAMRIARTFEFGLNMTQRQLKRLEEEGVLVSRRLGNLRLFSFNDRNPTVRNLQQMLEAELAALPDDDLQRYFRQRQRPRLSEKPQLAHV